MSEMIQKGMLLIIIGMMLIIVGLFLNVVFLDKILSDNNSFDCAKNYDRLVTFTSSDFENFSNNQIEFFAYYAPLQLMENRCFIAIDNWAHESLYESLILESNWEKMAFDNKQYLGEVSCESICKEITEQRELYQQYMLNLE